MVQRKSIDKLRIILPDDQGHDQQTRLRLNPEKPSSPRGTEVKKKMMKKSKPAKLSDFGQKSLKASPSTLVRKSLPRPSIVAAEKIVEKSPNYMKATSCFEARKSPARVASSSKLAVRNLTKTVSFKPPRKSSSNVVVQRATCSSTLKDSKFPDYLKLKDGGSELEGTSIVKVCPYTYCSLNGHHHKLASLPPLKRVVAAGRRALKKQKSTDGEETLERVGLDFFVEIYPETERKSGFVSEQVAESLSDRCPRSEIDIEESPEQLSEMIGESEARIAEDSEAEEAKEIENETEGSFPGESVSEMEWEEEEFPVLEIENESEVSSEVDYMSESSFGSSAEIEDSVSDLLEVDQSASSGDEFDELSGDEDQFEESEVIAEVFEDLKAGKMTEQSSEIGEPHEALEEAKATESFNLYSQTKQESEDQVVMKAEESSDQETEAFGEDEIKITEEKNSGESKPSPPFSHEQESSDEELRNKWNRGKRGINDSDEDSARDFNPREPNYLPPATDPAGETVDLKHQDMDERKNPGDWMIDRALQETVTKLGPARKRRVSLLIEAFETVSPITDFELRRPSLHRHHHPSSPVFPHAIRPIQACS